MAQGRGDSRRKSDRRRRRFANEVSGLTLESSASLALWRRPNRAFPGSQENRTNWAAISLARRVTREPNRRNLYCGSLARGLCREPNTLYRSIPHDLGRDFLPAGTFFTLNVARIISPDLIPRCFAYRACIQILVFLPMVQDAVIRTCVYLLNF